MLIHFPIALFIAGVIFDFLAQRAKWRALAEVAYYNLLGAAISVVPVVATGVLAWQFQLEGKNPKVYCSCICGTRVGGPYLGCVGSAQ